MALLLPLLSLLLPLSRRIWRFKFEGEEALDAGGVAREWFDKVQ
jgi:hypothetical protein